MERRCRQHVKIVRVRRRERLELSIVIAEKQIAPHERRERVRVGNHHALGVASKSFFGCDLSTRNRHHVFATHGRDGFFSARGSRNVRAYSGTHVVPKCFARSDASVVLPDDSGPTTHTRRTKCGRTQRGMNFQFVMGSSPNCGAADRNRAAPDVDRNEHRTELAREPLAIFLRRKKRNRVSVRRAASSRARCPKISDARVALADFRP